jgi:O-antigen ligase
MAEQHDKHIAPARHRGRRTPRRDTGPGRHAVDHAHEPLTSVLRGYGLPFWIVAAFVLLTFAIGGSQRADLGSLAVLRPVAVLTAAYGLWSLRREDWTRHRLPLGIAAATLTLAIVHLLPLPPAIWMRLPGRGLIVEIDNMAAIGPIWRPISMVPAGGWNALFALFVPIAALTLAARLGEKERIGLAYLMLAIGLLTAIIGVVQLSGAGDALYFYRYTNEGAAVGLFANRNHQAAFLASLFPLLLFCAETQPLRHVDRRIRRFVALIVAVFLLSLILVTGSRAGFLISVVSVTGTALLFYRTRISRDDTPTAKKQAMLGIALILAPLLALAVVAISLNRDEAIDRMLRGGIVDPSRLENWKLILGMASAYFPFGSGIGSFQDVFNVGETYGRLDLKTFNHAHNDWLEIAMTAGLPGLILLAIGVGALVRMAYYWWRSPPGDAALLGGAGLWMIVVLALASVTDYPLRVPSLSCLFAVAFIWANALCSTAQTEKDI